VPPPRYSGLNKPKSQSVRDSTTRLQRAARERADDEARRIPWQRLLDTQNQYIDWQEFYLWVRSLLEVEDRIPDWLIEILNIRVPGFIATLVAGRPVTRCCISRPETASGVRFPDAKME
jgi:hypothetical protein